MKGARSSASAYQHAKVIVRECICAAQSLEMITFSARSRIALAGLLRWRDVRGMDWSTLLPIVGGIALGALLDESGLVRAGAARIPLSDLPPFARLLALSSRAPCSPPR